MKKTLILTLSAVAIVALSVFAGEPAAAGLAMIPIASISPLQGWKQGQPGGAVEFVEHTFEASSDGQLIHSSNGQVRAIVPPESWLKYLEAWPEAEPIVEQLTRPTDRSPIPDGDVDSLAPAPAAAAIGADVPSTMPAWLEPILMRLDRLETATTAAAAAKGPDQAPASPAPPAGA